MEQDQNKAQETLSQHRNDIAQAKRLEEDIKRVQAELSNFFITPGGAYVADFMKESLMAPSFVPGQSYEATAFLEGQRHYMREILIMGSVIGGNDGRDE